MTYVGIDVHVKTSQICEVNAEDEVVWERQIPTTDAKLREVFGSREGLRIVMESGGSTPWIRRVLQELGHEVVVVNPRQIRLVAREHAEMRSHRCTDPGAAGERKVQLAATGLPAQRGG